MKRLAILLMCFAVWAPGSAFADKLGVVLIHGKQGFSGEKPLAYIVQQLQSAGVLVDQPDMCWSRNRIYDHTLAECMADVDTSIARLRNRGATAIVVAGHSLGGFGALYYGATHTGLIGIVALAPAPGPGIARRPEIAASLQRAQSLIGEGQGDVFQNFTDINTTARGTGPIEVKATANIFVSFFDMSRGASMVVNASQLKAPVLWISGTRDPSQIPRTAGFDQAASNPLNRYEQIDAAHMETPDKAANIVVDWLKALPSK